MRILAIVSVAVLAVMLGVLASHTTSYGATYTVNSTADDPDGDTSDGVCDTGSSPNFTNVCTLRAAIETANQTTGTQDTINFNIAGTGPFRISLLSPLPSVTGPVIIDGYSQPGSSVNTLAMNQGTNAVLEIELDASSAGITNAALVIEAGNSTVRGLVINDVAACAYPPVGAPVCNGIELRTAGGNTIQGNFIGTDVTGMITDLDSTSCNGTEIGNIGNGIFVNNVPNNLIGGSTPDAVNLISGNGRGCTNSQADGIEINGSGASGNVVKGNFIGTNAAGSTNTTGTTDLGNEGNGILIVGAANTTIGGTTLAERNVIAGNNHNGIAQTGSGGTGTLIVGNVLGMDASGTKKRANGQDGININGGASNTIGGTAAGTRNIISGNNSDGIEIAGGTASGNSVIGNYVGLDISGGVKQGNGGSGVYLNGAPNNIVGGTTAAARNIISGNSAKGVAITSSGGAGNVVEGNYIGTDVAGTVDLGNSNDGVFVGGPTNTIGGASASARNLISGNNNHGIEVNGTSASGNIIRENYIGTDVSGGAPVGNTQDGVYVTSAANTQIGGQGTGNLISGNGSRGIEISTASSTGTQVLDNFIGTDVTGATAVSNGRDGIYINGAKNTIIGGTSLNTGNVISANGGTFIGSGVYILGTGASGTQLMGNLIGTNLAGNAKLSNSGDGVTINVAPSTVVGGTSIAARNLISGNLGRGVQIAGSTATGNTVLGNYIGVNASGGGANMGNGGDGVYIFQGVSNTVGGTSAGARNIISSNAAVGVELQDTATSNLVEGNYIGTDAAGNTKLGNVSYGVFLNGAGGNTIGGTAAGAGNLISGNSGGGGVFLSGLGATGNLIQGNLIGTNAAGTGALGNVYDGVRIDASASGNTIGGSAAGAANKIAYNGGNGVLIGSGTGDRIDSNSIFDNTTLGIELGNDGVTPNDPGDADTGPNNLQNYPVLSAASSTGGNTSISGTLNSAASTVFGLQFFASPACDSSGYGEGATLLGSTNVTTDAGGNVSFSSSFPVAVTGGYSITSAATDPTGNTSEFSACLALASTDSDGDGVPDNLDNCPNWYNPAQNLPPWTVPANDPDCDGFSSTIEGSAGTLALSHCPATATANDEDPDAWPPDFNDDQQVNITDILLVKPHFGSSSPSPAYSARFDLNADGHVNIVDVLSLKPFFGKTCA